MEKHVNIVAALRIGFGIICLLIGLIGFTVLHFIVGFVDDPTAEMVLPIIANAVIIFFVLLSIPGIIAGIGLFKRKEWARILTLIISVLDLFNFPLGTAVGVYSIWVLSNEENVALFKKQK